MTKDDDMKIKSKLFYFFAPMSVAFTWIGAWIIHTTPNQPDFPPWTLLPVLGTQLALMILTCTTIEI